MAAEIKPFFALDYKKKEEIIKDCFSREDIKTPQFRHMILSYQFVELAKIISHDPKVNPGAAAVSGEDLAVGQVLVQIGVMAESLGISLRPAHSLEHIIIELDGKFGEIAGHLQNSRLKLREKKTLVCDALSTLYNLSLFRGITPAAAWTAGLMDFESKSWQQGGKKPKQKPILEDKLFNYAPLEKRINAGLRGENPDIDLRSIITMQQILALGRYVAHDPKINPNARPHTIEEETKEHGQALVQLAVLAKYWGISLAGYHAPQRFTQTLGMEFGKLSSLLKNHRYTLAEVKPTIESQLERLLSRVYVYALLRGIKPEQAWQCGIANQIDADWRKRQGKFVDGRLQGIYVGPELSMEGIAYIHNSTEMPQNVPPNAILVTRHFNPDMMHLLSKFCGAVTDEGGKTCHLAVTMRDKRAEYLPCVIGTGVATKHIKPSDKLCIEHIGAPGSEQGTVTILKYKPQAQQ